MICDDSYITSLSFILLAKYVYIIIQRETINNINTQLLNYKGKFDNDATEVLLRLPKNQHSKKEADMAAATAKPMILYLSLVVSFKSLPVCSFKYLLASLET